MTWELDFCYQTKNFSMQVHQRITSPSLTLWGASGSGKSTFIEILLGLRGIQSLQGYAKFKDTLLFDTRSQQCLANKERPFAWLPQTQDLFPHLSVVQNINLTSRLPQQALRHAYEILAIGSILDRFPHQLSGGERQRAALARAIATGKKCILLDEPTSSLDTATKAKVLSYILHAIKEFEISMVFVTHDPEEVRQVAGEVLNFPLINKEPSVWNS